mmetsp:Transcript_23041/g.75110  ORF Transcript_23041/g.75110 Transcript_23041/m.75110 type:complete len:306 (+) Transcript_23041:489-1406(+)
MSSRVCAAAAWASSTPPANKRGAPVAIEPSATHPSATESRPFMRAMVCSTVRRSASMLACAEPVSSTSPCIPRSRSSSTWATSRKAVVSSSMSASYSPVAVSACLAALLLACSPRIRSRLLSAASASVRARSSAWSLSAKVMSSSMRTSSEIAAQSATPSRCTRAARLRTHHAAPGEASSSARCSAPRSAGGAPTSIHDRSMSDTVARAPSKMAPPSASAVSSISTRLFARSRAMTSAEKLVRRLSGSSSARDSARKASSLRFRCWICISSSDFSRESRRHSGLITDSHRPSPVTPRPDAGSGAA